MKAAENYNQCTNDYTEYDSDYSEDDTSDEDSTTPTMNITNLSPLEKHAICMRKLNLEVLQNYVKANPEDAAARKRLEKSVAVSTPGLLDCNLYWGARYNPHLPPAET